MTIQIDEIRSLSVKERLRLLGEIWESLSAEPAELPLTTAQRKELDRRIAAHRRDPSAARPWAEVRAKLERRRK